METMSNKWTRDDLPGIHSPGIHGHEGRQGADAALDAVVAHLNERHPKPCANRVLVAGQSPAWVFRALEDDHQQALAKVERERDAAVARAEQAERERDEADHRTAEAEADRDRWKLHHDRVDGQWAKTEREVTKLRAMERERDEWKARAEAAERERDMWRNSYGIAAVYLEQARERAEKAENARDEAHQPAPAVSRADVEKAVRRGHNMLNAEVGVVNEMCDLIGIETGQAVDPDPVEVTIRRGLTVWGVTDKAVQEIAASVRHVLGQEASDE